MQMVEDRCDRVFGDTSSSCAPCKIFSPLLSNLPVPLALSKICAHEETEKLVPRISAAAPSNPRREKPLPVVPSAWKTLPFHVADPCSPRAPQAVVWRHAEVSVIRVH